VRHAPLPMWDSCQWITRAGIKDCPLLAWNVRAYLSPAIFERPRYTIRPLASSLFSGAPRPVHPTFSGTYFFPFYHRYHRIIYRGRNARDKRTRDSSFLSYYHYSLSLSLRIFPPTPLPLSLEPPRSTTLFILFKSCRSYKQYSLFIV
jgi:hypothetical protein